MEIVNLFVELHESSLQPFLKYVYFEVQQYLVTKSLIELSQKANYI